MKAPVTLRVVMYEGAGSRAIDAAVRSAALTKLLEQGYGVTRVSPDGGEPTAPGAGPVAVLGRFEATPPPSGDANGRQILFSEIDGLSADDIVAKVESLHAQAGSAPRQKW